MLHPFVEVFLCNKTSFFWSNSLTPQCCDSLDHKDVWDFNIVSALFLITLFFFTEIDVFCIPFHYWCTGQSSLNQPALLCATVTWAERHLSGRAVGTEPKDFCQRESKYNSILRVFSHSAVCCTVLKVSCFCYLYWFIKVVTQVFLVNTGCWVHCRIKVPRKAVTCLCNGCFLFYENTICCTSSATSRSSSMTNKWVCSDYIPKISVIIYMLYVPANFLLFLRFVFFFYWLLIMSKFMVLLSYKRVLHHIEGPIMEDLYNPNNQKVLFFLSCASVVATVTFHSSNFNKAFRVLSYLYSFHHMINMMVTSTYLMKYIYVHCFSSYYSTEILIKKKQIIVLHL